MKVFGKYRLESVIQELTGNRVVDNLNDIISVIERFLSWKKEVFKNGTF